MSLPLRTRIIALCMVIMTLALVAVATANFLDTRATTLAQASTQAQQIASAHAQRLAQWLASKQQVVHALRPHITADTRLQVLQTAVQSAGFDQAYMGYPDGSYLFSEQRSTRAADYDPRTRAWYQGALAQGGPAISEPYIGASTGKLIITFSELVGTPQQPQAVVAGDVMLDVVVQSIAAIHPTDHSFAFLVSGQDTVIAHPDAQWLQQPLRALHPQLTGQALRATAQASTTWRLHDRDYYVYAQPIAGTPWSLAVAMDAQEITADLYATLHRSLWATAAVCVLAAIVLYVAIHRALARLHQVQGAIRAAGAGDFTARLAEHGQDELTHMAHAYNQFAANITEVLHQIQSASTSVELAASEIAAGNQHLSVRTEQQADALSQTAASIHTLTENVQHNAAHAQSANALALSASDVAHKGGHMVAAVVEVMGDIHQSSRRIADIIGVIDGIAFKPTSWR